MNVHKHFINTPLAPPFFYSNRCCFVSLEINRLSGKLGVIKVRRSGADQKTRIGREMRADKNFIFSSHLRRNRAPCLPPTGLAPRSRTGRLLPFRGKPSVGAGSGAALLRNRPIFLPPGGPPIGKAPSQRVQGRYFSRSRDKPSLPPLSEAGGCPSSCLHSLAIGLADSGCPSGRHTFQKFYFKKTIINNISRQKKHTFSMIKGDKMIILRPLLKFSRFEFLKFCEFWYLPIIPDFTNFNVCFRRNNLRLQFIPYLKIFLNLNLSQKIDQFQQILKLENQYLQFILKKIHGGTFYGETPSRLDRPPKGGLPLSPMGLPLGEQAHLAMARCCGERSAPAKLDPRLPLGLPPASFTPSKSSLGRRPLCADGTEGTPPGARRAAFRGKPSARVPLDRPSTFGEATKGFQGVPLRSSARLLPGGFPKAKSKPFATSPWRMGDAQSIGRPSWGKRQAFSSSPLAKRQRAEPKPDASCAPSGRKRRKARPPEGRSMGNRQAQLPASAGCHTRHKAKPPSSGANAVIGQFSLCTKPDRKRLSAHVSPKSGCFLHDYRKNYFFYFPKIFQYLIIHNFYYLVSKKISFNEISCIFQKLKPQSKSK